MMRLINTRLKEIRALCRVVLSASKNRQKSLWEVKAPILWKSFLFGKKNPILHFECFVKSSLTSFCWIACLLTTCCALSLKTMAMFSAKQMSMYSIPLIEATNKSLYF